jgi:hypothetical protein
MDEEYDYRMRMIIKRQGVVSTEIFLDLEKVPQGSLGVQFKAGVRENSTLYSAPAPAGAEYNRAT